MKPKRKIEYVERLKAIAPTVAVAVFKELDDSFPWDGSGPDPRRRGYYPHTVTVRLTTVVAGEIKHAETCLGDSYYRHDEPLGEVHGYLPQMLRDAFEELNQQLNSQFTQATEYLTSVMRSLWQAQQP